MSSRVGKAGTAFVLVALVVSIGLALVLARAMRSTEPTFIEPIRLPVVLDPGSIAEGSPSLRVMGTLDGQAVGFTLQVLPGWTTNRHELGASLPNMYMTWGPVALRRSGPESDTLLRALEGRLLSSSSARRFKQVVSAEAVCLTGSPEQMTAAPVTYKLFLGSAGTPAYAELFLQVDLQRGYIEVSEKDLGYRSALLQALAE